MAKKSVVEGLMGINSKKGLVTVASTASIDTILAKRLVLVAFDLPNSIAG